MRSSSSSSSTLTFASPSLFLAATCVVAACSTTVTEQERSSGDPASDPTASTPSNDPASGESPPTTKNNEPPASKTPATKPAGTFPPSWNDGTSCSAEPEIQSWAYDTDTTLIRQSLCTHYEAPFMILLVGASKAMLVDTGTGDTDVRGAVDAALANRDVDLVVAHSHAHSDHVGGDAQFVGRPRTTIVGHSPSAVAQSFKIASQSPSSTGVIDLGGGRIVDVLTIPGHEASHVAFYDRETHLLLTGDTLYPGRLYVRDWSAYRASVTRLVAFVDAGHPVSHVLGGHIELSAANIEYTAGATKHPGEHVLQLGEPDLRDLLTTVNAMGTTPVRTVRTGYVVVPLR